MSREEIPGWDPLVALYRKWLEKPPRQGAVVVEVGVALGKTVSFIADWCLANNRTDIEVWAVDSWEHNAPNGEQQQWAKLMGGDFSLYAKSMLEHDPKAFEFARVVRARSEVAARMFADASVDLVAVDADHSYEGCLRDITAWRPTLRLDGMIGGDDHHEKHHPGVIQACQESFGVGYDVINEANGWPDGRVWWR